MGDYENDENRDITIERGPDFKLTHFTISDIRQQAFQRRANRIRRQDAMTCLLTPNC